MKTRTENIVEFKKSDAKKQIVFGEVYVPNVRDTDGNFMTAETIEKMAHDFLANKKKTAFYVRQSYCFILTLKILVLQHHVQRCSLNPS